jgi:DNA modification methylase
MDSVQTPGRRTVSIRSPKLAPARSTVPTPGSKYYAGYDAGFVSDVIAYLSLDQDSLVLDPWNGAGTTTKVAADYGISSIGIDINPAVVLIAKSKLLTSDVAESLDALTSEILARARSHMECTPHPDELDQWFAFGTARYLRSIERSIHNLLVAPGKRSDFSSPTSIDAVSPLAASFYVSLFETVRSFLGTYRSSNPTWFKASPNRGDVSVAKDRIDSRFRAVEARHHRHIRTSVPTTDGREGRAVLKLASSTATGIAAAAVDACITSPPYCTRIDYAMMTRPELAVLGLDKRAIRELREIGIGSPTILKSLPPENPSWGPYIQDFLCDVRMHKSKASAGYYLKYFVQYFDAMHRSLKEVRRVVKPGGASAIVVQDSYYKEIRFDLGRGIEEMAMVCGWREVERMDFVAPHRRANMNPNARKYRASAVATESLLILS